MLSLFVLFGFYSVAQASTPNWFEMPTYKPLYGIDNHRLGLFLVGPLVNDIPFEDQYGEGNFKYVTDGNGCRRVELEAYSGAYYIRIKSLPSYVSSTCNNFNETEIYMYDGTNQVYMYLNGTETSKLFNSSGHPNADLKWLGLTDYADQTKTFSMTVVTTFGQLKTTLDIWDSFVYGTFPYGFGSYHEAAGDWLAGN
jgi:hypothetical protein